MHVDPTTIGRLRSTAARALAGAAGEGDNALALVELERLAVGGGGFVESPGGLENVAEVEDRVALACRRVGCLA